jgi:hypothetical protein
VAIEIIKKVVIKGDAEADEFLHGATNIKSVARNYHGIDA